MKRFIGEGLNLEEVESFFGKSGIITFDHIPDMGALTKAVRESWEGLRYDDGNTFIGRG
ncbi:MAG: hypothetical protein H6Q48_490 [Deltaproteobacteria bacterium]|jgi:hypothetical protein|nr:hypothetical protein [Deltaproteobacteria bacterium]